MIKNDNRGKAAVPANGPAANVSQPLPQTGDCVANESGVHSSDLELIPDHIRARVERAGIRAPEL